MSGRTPKKNEALESDVAAFETSRRLEEEIDLFSELGDVLVEPLLKDGPIESVPVLGAAVKVLRGVQSVRNAHFMRKLSEFVRASPRVSDEKRAAFLAKFDADSQFRKRTMEHLIAVLDRLDDVEKAPCLARIFAALVAGEITPDQMRRFCIMLDRATLADLRALRRFVEASADARLTLEEFDGLEGIGLAAIQHSIVRPKVPGEVVGRVNFGGTDLLVSVNPTGRRFVEIAVVGREDTGNVVGPAA